MKTEGSISIGRVQSNEGTDSIRITFTDLRSRLQFAEANIDTATFARMITGLAGLDCEMDLRGLTHVGKYRITKVIKVRIPEEIAANYRRMSMVDAQALLKPYEVDGWQGDTYHLIERRSSKDEDGHFTNTRLVKYVEEKPSGYDEERNGSY